MRRPITFMVTCLKTGLEVASFWCMVSIPGLAVELPAGPLSALESDEFQTRETAQGELLAWARLRPEEAMEALFGVSRSHEDPEVRERCLAVLRELVNDEYLKDGEGYIGVRMLDETALVPGETKPRSVIRVIQVVPDSAAHRAGLKLNDLIAGLDDKIWRDQAASVPFMERIRNLKPGNRVTLRVLRDGKMIDVEVKLGRRPPLPDSPFMDPRQVDLEASERAAKEAYFRRWLERRKAGDQGRP